MTWHGCAGINPISGCTTPDDIYLPGRGVLQPPHDYVMALSANLEPPGLWCLLWRLAIQFWLAAAADVAVATRQTAGVLWSWALGPACVRQVSSVLAIGWWGASMAWHAACAWRLLFFRPSTAAASLPRLSTSFTGYHWFTSMRDGRGPVTQLSADGARPSVNVPTPWREATSAVAEVWFGDACALYLVQHVGGSVAHTDHDLAFGYVEFLRNLSRSGAPKAASSHSPRWAQAVAALQTPNNNNNNNNNNNIYIYLSIRCCFSNIIYYNLSNSIPW